MGSLNGLAGNVRLVQWVYAGQGALFWLPTFVLYFSQTLSPAEVLTLEAVYNGAIVALEVPSGWMSDRFGRRLTLMVSGFGWAAGALAMAVGGHVLVFAAGQVLLAVGRSFASGTDSSILYESLAALDREDEFGAEQARAASINFGALAAGSLVGGLVGVSSLVAPYLLSAVGGLVAMGAAFLLTEPPHTAKGSEWSQAPKALRRAVSVPEVRWVLAAVVAFTVFSHIPYELLQPWLEGLVDNGTTPLVSGVMVAVALGGASIGSAVSPALTRRFGAKPTVLFGMAWVVAVMLSMALEPSYWVVPLLLLRSVPTGIVGPVTAGMVHPHLDSSIRATYLSLQSLLGRLAFVLTLLVASAAVGDTWDLATLRAVLLPASAACVLVLVFLAWLPLRPADG